jgi:hypothetical protein
VLETADQDPQTSPKFRAQLELLKRYPPETTSVLPPKAALH